jgi:dynein heavy chain 2
MSSLSGRSLVFFKSKQDAITEDNYKSNILISSIVDSPMESLFYLIHNLYSPAIQQSSSSRSSTDVYESKLTNNLVDLESNLKMSIRRAEAGDSNKKSSVSPLDEFQYWAEEKERGKSREQRDRAAFFYDEFKSLIEYYRKIETCPLQEILEIIEATQDSYDYVWQQVDFEPSYSQDRMTNLLEITGMTILKSLLNKLLKIKPFEVNFSEVKELLKHAIAVCDRWIECCHNLYRVWKSNQTHRWDSDEYVPTSIIKYCRRLNEVLQIRSAKEQYAILIKTVKDEPVDEGKSSNYSQFDGIEPLQYNPYTESKWQEAVQAYDRSMSYMDQKTAQILKMHLRQAQSNPRQVSLFFIHILLY